MYLFIYLFFLLLSQYFINFDLLNKILCIEILIRTMNSDILRKLQTKPQPKKLKDHVHINI